MGIQIQCRQGKTVEVCIGFVIQNQNEIDILDAPWLARCNKKLQDTIAGQTMQCFGIEHTLVFGVCSDA